MSNMSEIKVISPEQASYCRAKKRICRINSALQDGHNFIEVRLNYCDDRDILHRMHESGWVHARVVTGHLGALSRDSVVLAWDEPSPNEINVLEQGNKGV
jgi:hypothetical protein